MNNDFGASHNFQKKKEKEIRTSKTVYFKIRHLHYISCFADQNGYNLSEAFDVIIQCGIAYQEQLRIQREVKQDVQAL